MAIRTPQQYIESLKDGRAVYCNGGSLEAQKLSIYALADFEKYKAAARRATRIDDGTKQSIYSQLPDFPPVGLP